MPQPLVDYIQTKPIPASTQPLTKRPRSIRLMVLFELAFGIATLSTVPDAVSASLPLGLVRILTVAGVTVSMIAVVSHKSWGWWFAGVIAMVGLITAAGPAHDAFRSTEAIPQASSVEVVTACLVIFVSVVGFIAERRRAHSRLPQS